MPHYWKYIQFITNLGDSAVLLPICFCILILLLIFRDYRLSAAWAISVGLCVVAIVALKIAFRTCGPSWTSGAIISPSGHVAFSCTVYGALATLIAIRSASYRARIILPIAAVMLAVLIGLTRVALGAHNIAEVILGLGVGLIFVALFRWLVSTARPRAPILIIVPFAVLPLIALHGHRLNAEDSFELIASKIRGATGLCLIDESNRSLTSIR